MLMALFAASLVYPTVLWTVALGFVILYWLLVAGGAWDVAEMHETGDASAHPADPVFQAEDAAADGARAAIGDGHHLHPSDAGGLFSRQGLRHMPPMVIGTAIVLLNFWGCYFAVRVTGPLPVLRGGVLMVVVLALSLPVAVLLSWPLRPLFKVHEASRRGHS